MGKAKKALEAFIDKIPASKLTGFSTSPGTIYSDDDFRLDMQKINNDKTHNLQIQANKQSSITSVKGLAPKTVAGPVSAKSDADAETVRTAFKNKILI
ncbi:hypothetical protein GALMADRAFT_101921 [Galerina marginata CBS 339.88]|uniref:Uncharacterized protein n=1 Tax=Galerina marginata (strain CBS 339.88) TaxID=685588 RepID=A0A067SPA0_GALM3|nr:hypothetical protein GALMADRAFT_101921 [Galerina marginata CBS 339.88]